MTIETKRDKSRGKSVAADFRGSFSLDCLSVQLVPSLSFCLFIGLPNCTSHNGISRKEIGGDGGYRWKGIGETGVGTEELHT